MLMWEGRKIQNLTPGKEGKIINKLPDLFSKTVYSVLECLIYLTKKGVFCEKVQNNQNMYNRSNNSHSKINEIRV